MDFLASRRQEYLDQPAEVSIETFAHCNANCSFCPYPTISRKGERMSDELLYRLVDEMATFDVPFMVSPFKVNEPLLDGRFIDFCRAIEAHTIAALRIFTNGAPLTQRRIDEIASLNRVYHLWISLNSHNPQEYEELMGIPFERTAKRLDNLHEQDFPFNVVLSTVGFPNEAFRRYCFDRWPNFESTAIQKSSWLGYTEAQNLVVPDSPCARWFELSIMANGVVSLCCMDGEGQFPIGDLRESTLLEVYNSPHYRERRERLLSRLQVDVCNTCTY